MAHRCELLSRRSYAAARLANDALPEPDMLHWELQVHGAYSDKLHRRRGADTDTLEM